MLQLPKPLTALCLVLAACGSRMAHAAPAPLPAEAIPALRALPPQFPPSWVLVHDVNSNSITDGRIVLVDTGPAAEVRGQVPASYLANFQFSAARHEIYVAETYYSRVSRGERTDMITVWDSRTLDPKAEIALPGGKRAIFVPMRHGFQLLDNESLALVFNFTPAASVSVVDLATHKVLTDIDVPGCALTYPLAGRNFATLCGDGTLLNITLEKDGQLASSQPSERFNDIDADPVFMEPAFVGRTAWFATFHGNLKSIDMSGPAARIGAEVKLPQQPDGKPQWRPGGIQVIASDRDGKLYLLMNPRGGEGTHKDGGTEVWQIDPSTARLSRRFALKTHAISIAVTHEAQPHLITIGINRALQVYDTTSGEFVREVPNVGISPLALAVSP